MEPTFTRFVAIGDSQTEGIGDPDGNGGHHGWADRFAALLAATGPLEYANLAVRGRRAAEIRAGQLSPALALQPDLVTVVAGMNDILRPRFDRDALLGDIDAMFAALTEGGARVVTFTFPDIGAVAPFARLLSGRVRTLNADLRALAARRGVTLVDFEPVLAASHPAAWDEDRLHLSPIGHDIVARALAFELGVSGADDTWREPLPTVDRVFAQRVGTEVRWVIRYLGPWIGRRLRGTSSGTGREAKRPELLPVGRADGLTTS
ncbi:lysophospholipase L1-like esterase [Nocardia tenerifensis]|uniref:Lysophospholipase L1-like esterase n=1 Tax=Nocardia tenerifensis TaxID=228006 RepID=A0A318KE02_9NOCA|nr:SGNH/GDSL hydrolase family protein [Nocardia tenerifensis]PXX71029.1 lysophospholipase L1-like esterase [Nocardia tenerifensis]